MGGGSMVVGLYYFFRILTRGLVRELWMMLRMDFRSLFFSSVRWFFSMTCIDILSSYIWDRL